PDPMSGHAPDRHAFATSRNDRTQRPCVPHHKFAAYLCAQPAPRCVLVVAVSAASGLLLGLVVHPPGHESNPKIDGWVAGGSGRGPVIAGRGCERRWWSGGGVEGDPVAEGLELADVVELFAFGVDAGVVEVRAEVVEAGVGVAQQVPDDD